LKNGERIAPQQARQRFPRQVGADERAVEVNDERDIGSIGHSAAYLATDETRMKHRFEIN
jgi:hypothetical protein